MNCKQYGGEPAPTRDGIQGIGCIVEYEPDWVELGIPERFQRPRWIVCRSREEAELYSLRMAGWNERIRETTNNKPLRYDCSEPCKDQCPTNISWCIDHCGDFCWDQKA
jgi:hypothetical protein